MCAQKHFEGSVLGIPFFCTRGSPVINFFTHNLVDLCMSSCSYDTKPHKYLTWNMEIVQLLTVW
jgi:hypothetical protein